MNAIAMRTLFLKELRRFSKVWLQTVFSPLVTTSLYFLVFGVALGSRLNEVNGVPYVEFVVSGLMMLAMISNAFLNTSSSLFQSKINGTLADLLSAPIGTPEIMGAYVAAAVLRGLLVGALVWLVALAFTGVRIEHPAWVFGFSIGVTATFACFGIIASVWAEKFDQLSIIPNFVLTPLTFLGGVFYSVDMLPEPWNTISHANPILYMVNGLRYGLLDVADVAPGSCVVALLISLAVSFAGAWSMLQSGYKLRA